MKLKEILILMVFSASGVACGATLTETIPVAYPGQQRCDYTFIEDIGTPEMGKDGEIAYSEEWQRVLEQGWRIKTSAQAVSGAGWSATTGYVLERCADTFTARAD